MSCGEFEIDVVSFHSFKLAVKLLIDGFINKLRLFVCVETYKKSSTNFPIFQCFPLSLSSRRRNGDRVRRRADPVDADGQAGAVLRRPRHRLLHVQNRRELCGGRDDARQRGPLHQPLVRGTYYYFVLLFEKFSASVGGWRLNLRRREIDLHPALTLNLRV